MLDLAPDVGQDITGGDAGGIGVQNRSMTMAMAIMEQRMIGNISQPPACTISNTGQSFRM
jgi:hypothetical protein